MKQVVFVSGGYRKYAVEVPESYSEGYKMLTEVLDPSYKTRGKDGARGSAAARVVYGLFWADAGNPTEALVRFLRELCRHEGEWHNDAEDHGEAPSASERRKRLSSRKGGGAEDLSCPREEGSLTDT